jgi:formylglycine-generating enzyme required for sulfatase activity
MDELKSLRTQLEKKARLLQIEREKAAGFTSLTIPAELQLSIEELEREVTEIEARLKAAYDLRLKCYLERAIIDYRTLKFRGLGARERGIETPGLERAFITIRMAAEAEGKKQAEKAGKRGMLADEKMPEMRQAAETVELAKAVRLSTKLAIIGGAGSGKSTLLQWAGLAAAKQHLETGALSDEQAAFVQALGERPLIPVLLPLRSFSRYCQEKKHTYTASGMLHFIHDHLNEQYPTLKLPEDFFERLLKDEGCLVMFDGVDEVEPDERGGVREAIEALVNEFQANRRNRYLVTSRTVAYFGEAQVGGFRRCDVQQLSPEQRDRLIHNWCEAVDGEEVGCQKADDLIGRINGSDERVKALAVTPLMVTIFALVYYDQADLPRQRAELYEHAVRILLTEPYKENETAEELKKDWEARRDKLAFIAYQMHDCQAEDLLEDDLVDLAWPSFGTVEEERAVRKLARQFIRKVADRGGLLEEENRRYGFYTHRTFREFLVGRYLAEELSYEEQKAVLSNVLGKDTWREAVRLAAGYLAKGGEKRSDDFIWLVSRLGEDQTQHAQALTWAGLCVADLPPRQPQPVKWAERRKQVTGEMLQTLTANPPTVETRLRYELGLALAEAGDPRFKAKPLEGAKGVNAILPELVKVAAGAFRMGTNKEDKKRLAEQKAKSWEDEEPAHMVRLAEYWIGKYPVTNAEFRCFYDEQGYERQDLWSMDGWKWRTGQWDSDLSGYSEDVQESIRRQLSRRPVEGRGQPFFWDDPQWKAANQPAVGVTWFEAQAYCNWLKALTGKNYCLPTEAQWEKAGRGEEGRLWPWGDTWEAERCNNREADSALSKTSPVGMYPHGTSPYGVHDLAGNVWEWCADWYDEKEYQRCMDIEVVDPPGPDVGSARVVRGGCCYNNRDYARCAYRSWGVPGFFSNYLGFRVVCFPI